MIKNLPTWTMAHIYVIDFFLWYMAKCGYTLQKSRAKIDFIDYQNDIRASKVAMMEKLRKECLGKA